VISASLHGNRVVKAHWICEQLSSFRDAPLGAGPESITPAESMDSGLARFTRAPE
jgi:hypothetical protein